MKVKLSGERKEGTFLSKSAHEGTNLSGTGSFSHAGGLHDHLLLPLQ